MLPANRPSISMAQPRCVPSSQPRGIAVNAYCSLISRVLGTGIDVHRRITGSLAISTRPSTSDGACARSVTTPSLRTGTLSGHLMRRRSWVERAERVGRIDAEDLDVGREELELLERAAQWRVLGMAVDLGEELRRGELAADHVALQLGHVDPVGREAPERLVERGRQVADVEDEARHG